MKLRSAAYQRPGGFDDERAKRAYQQFQEAMMRQAMALFPLLKEITLELAEAFAELTDELKKGGSHHNCRCAFGDEMEENSDDQDDE